MGKLKQRRVLRKISAWSQSAAFREIGSAAIRKFNAERHLLPQCDATAKSTGYQCGNLALLNGKCHLHGGRTPKGDQWHVRQLPTGNAKTAVTKFDRKIDKAGREERSRRRWLKQASEQERAAYEKWLWTHLKGNAAARAARRLNRRIADERSHLLAENRKRPNSPEVQELIDRIEELKAYREFVKQAHSGVFQ